MGRDVNGERPMLTSREVARKLQINVRTLWRMVAAGQFPEPVRYTRRTVRWPEEVVARHTGGQAQAG